jgi:uncharacterized protein (DUF4415 family)
MRKRGNIKRYSAEALRQKIERGASKTDWQRANAVSQATVERFANHDEGPLPEDWENSVIIGLPPAKHDVHIRLDGDVIEWFKRSGRGYQTRINAVLRAFVESRRDAGRHDTMPRRAHRRKAVR